MLYFCGMKERINWIDWTKTWCMTVVVFCHLPQQEDTFLLKYLSSVLCLWISKKIDKLPQRVTQKIWLFAAHTIYYL